ncbi:hypothetical protein D3C79_858760 [compost metagenome]
MGVAGEVVGKQNGDSGEGHYDEGHHVGDGPIAGADQLLIHPDGQRGLLARGEGGDYHLVKAQRERQHAPRQQGGGEVGQDHITQGLEAVGTEIHRGLDQRLVGAAKARKGVVVDHHHAEGGVAYDDGPEAERDLQQAVGGAQRYAGDYAGQGDGQHQQERHHLLAEETAAGDGPRRQGAEHHGRQGRESRHLQRQLDGAPHIGSV